MSHKALTNHAGGRIVELIIVLFLVQLSLFGYVLYQSYEGRKLLVEDLRIACMDRNKAGAGYVDCENQFPHVGFFP